MGPVLILAEYVQFEKSLNFSEAFLSEGSLTPWPATPVGGAGHSVAQVACALASAPVLFLLEPWRWSWANFPYLALAGCVAIWEGSR